MAKRRKYIKRAATPVVAVRLDLETPGFTYRKWGHEQRCKAGDWLVNNDGDTYTIDSDTFAETYEAVSQGLFVKTAPVWAEQASSAGAIRTKEGSTAYEEGDYLVFNKEDGSDGYAVSKERFEKTYAPSDGD